MSYQMDVEVIKRPQIKAGDTIVNGHGRFDAKGKALIPVKTKKGIEMKTQHEVESLLKKKKALKKQKIPKEELNGKKPKSSTINPEFARENTKARDAWIQRVAKELGVEVEHIKVNNEKTPTEPVLNYQGKRICWCAPRSGMLWSNYLFGKNERTITKIHNDDEAEKDYEWLKKRITEIKSEPKNQPPKTPKPKGKRKLPIKTPEQHAKDLKERMAKLSDSHQGISLPIGIRGNESWFKELVQAEGWILDLSNRILARASKVANTQ
ncbi:MAG: hypothetical protein JW840_09195 [Candidatus Thermoplasmatota archaeon]|nr:hypothetical protein [Candidatus Thermoplasmatota archaeon]